MENNKLDLSKAIHDGLAEPIMDVLQDIAESGIDDIIDNPSLREIPIVKSLIGIVKGGLAIREIYFVKKLSSFFSAFHKGDLDEEKRQLFLKKMKTDKDYCKSVINHVIVLNDRFINEKKSIVLANLLRAHINNCYDYNEFLNLSELLDSVPVRAFKPLEEAANVNPLGQVFTEINYPDNPKYADGPMLLGLGLVVVNSNYYTITHHGAMLYLYGIKGDINLTLKQFKDRE